MKKNDISHFLETYKQLAKQPAERQKVERASFGFDYQGESLSDDFEFSAPKVRWGKCIGFINTPVRNEYASGRVGFIDWLNFTFANEHKGFGFAIDSLSDDLIRILGFGVSKKRSRGLNFYQSSYVLGDNCGFVCIGGQNNTMMVSINGAGCSAARGGWEKRLHRWAAKRHRFQITRVDVAHDLFRGGYGVDNVVRDYDNGLFCVGGRVPKIQQYGNWRVPEVDNIDGRTVYIGTRAAGKLCRIYEKGKQLGQEDSVWVRIECEWRNRRRFIPDDILLRPGQYLAGAYPAFFFLSKVQSRVKTLNNKERILYDKAVEIAKRQVGGLVLLMSQVEPSAEEIVKKLVGDKVPERLVVPHWQGNRSIKCE